MYISLNCLIYVSANLEFEVSLIKALKALFCSPEGTPVAVLRFWMLLSVKLIAILNVQLFPKLSSMFQVINIAEI